MGPKHIVTKEELEHIAALARIELTEEEKERFEPELNAILDYFSVLDEIDAKVEPLHHVSELINIFREDEDGPSLMQSEVLENAPKKEEGYVKGPRIV